LGAFCESIYSALAAETTGASIRERLEPHLRAETIRTNDERDEDPVVSIHEWLLGELGFVKMIPFPFWGW